MNIKKNNRGDNEKIAYYKNRILNFIINNSGMYSVQDVSDIFGYSERRIQDFIKEYNSRGFLIKSRKGKLNIFAFPRNFKIITKPIEKHEFKKFILCSLIKNMCGSSGWVTRQYLIESITNEALPLTESSAYLQNLLRELKQEGYIDLSREKICVKKNFMNYLDKYKMLKLLIYLNIMKNVYPNRIELHQIFMKFLYKYEALGEKFQKDKVTYLNKHKISTYDELIMEVVEKAILQNKKIKFSYKTPKSTSEIVTAPKGIMYSQRKDMWYMICSRERDCVYRLDRVVDISILKEERNDDSFNKEFYSISISASNEEIEEVEVHFEKEQFIKKKLLYYKSLRKNSQIIELKDKYILKDRVCGINEFERWLRAFGKSAFCIKPEKLKNKILSNIELMKERYGI